MCYSEYVEFVLKHANCFEPDEIPIPRLQLLKDCVGLANELREYADNPISLSELGDVLFYLVAVTHQISNINFVITVEYIATPIEDMADLISDVAEKISRTSVIRSNEQKKGDLIKLKQLVEEIWKLLFDCGYSLERVIEHNVAKLMMRHSL